MEAWQAIFRNLYTGFLLRDFAGKIVPGVLLLFSICSMYREPKRLFQFLTKDVPTFTLIFIGGLAWTVTLGTQSLGEGLGIWRYFPVALSTPATGLSQPGFWRNLFIIGDDRTFDSDTLRIVEFQEKASEEEKQQYERFVVIKEACGNLFVTGLCSAPAWFFVFLRQFSVTSHNQKPLGKFNTVQTAGFVLGGLYVLLIMIGLHRMHAQHVHRQFQYANDLAEIHRIQPDASDGTVNLQSKPDASDVSVDGKYAGDTPATFKLRPGTHVFAHCDPREVTSD